MSKNVYYLQALEAARGNDPDYARAASLLEKAIEAGCPDAMYAVGSWYFHGRHFEQDIEKGIAYWERAANGGSNDAMIELGKFYEQEEFGKKDLEKAFYYYLDAALRENGQGCYEISRFFYYGFFVPVSEKISDLWRDKSEDLGYIGAVEEQQE